MGIMNCKNHGVTIQESVCEHIALSIEEAGEHLDLVFFMIAIDPEDENDVERYFVCSKCAEKHGVPGNDYKVSFNEFMTSDDSCVSATEGIDGACIVCFKNYYDEVETILDRNGFDTNKLFKIINKTIRKD